MHVFDFGKYQSISKKSLVLGKADQCADDVS